MAAHLREAPIILALAAEEDRIDRRLHVVVNAALAGPAEEGECPVMRIEHHLLALTRIGTHVKHPAVAKPHMRDLHRRRPPAEDHDLVAPIELIGLTWSEAQRHIGRRRRNRALPKPTRRIPTDSI